MKPCIDVRELPWVVHESVRAITKWSALTNGQSQKLLSNSITFKSRLFMRSGLVLSLVVLDGAGDIEKSFGTIDDASLQKIRFEGSLTFGWENKLGCIGGEKSSLAMLDKKLVKVWLGQQPDGIATICHDLLFSSDPVRFRGDKEIKLLPEALNLLDGLPLEKLCDPTQKSLLPLSFLSLFMEVTEFDDDNRLEKMGPKLHSFFKQENRDERIGQGVLARQFFMDAKTDIHIPYILEKFLINYATRADDVVLIQALHENISGPWESWTNEKEFLKTAFEYGSTKTIAYFLHKGEMLESLLRKEIADWGDDKISARMWASINDERMRMAAPMPDNFVFRPKI